MPRPHYAPRKSMLRERAAVYTLAILDHDDPDTEVYPGVTAGESAVHLADSLPVLCGSAVCDVLRSVGVTL